jgi:uncharacterized protein RhaS with RHS repeats
VDGGEIRRFAYDPAGMLSAVEGQDGCFLRLDYDEGRLVKRVTNETCSVELHRNALGRVDREQSGDVTVSSSYDACGARIGIESSLGLRMVIARDPVGLPASVYAGTVDGFSAPAVTFSRDVAGFEVNRTFANGISVDWSRERSGLPTARTVTRRTAAGTATPIHYSVPALLVDSRGRTKCSRIRVGRDPS